MKRLMNVVLAFLPIDDKNIQTTDYELFLVNDSNYYLQFNYLSKQNNGWMLRRSMTVEPNQQLFLEEISKLNLNDIEQEMENSMKINNIQPSVNDVIKKGRFQMPDSGLNTMQKISFYRYWRGLMIFRVQDFKTQLCLFGFLLF